MRELVTVIKDGALQNIGVDNLREGDIVFLQTGDLAPADLKLVESAGLEVDEFEITGELLPVVKKHGADGTMIYMGSRIIKGIGKGAVVAAGDKTEYGKVRKQLSDQNKANSFHISSLKYMIPILFLSIPFAIYWEYINDYMTAIGLYLLFSLFVLIYYHKAFIFRFLASKALAKYKKNNILISDTSVFEILAKIDTVCFDKTGVLTTRKMDVKKIFFMEDSFTNGSLRQGDRRSELINLACALCNDIMIYGRIDSANHVDKALISFAQKNGISVDKAMLNYKRIFHQPFDSEKRYMICGFEHTEETFCFAKGDPDVILKMCNGYMAEDGRTERIQSDFLLTNRSVLTEIGQSGDIVIALAYSSRDFNADSSTWTFLCLFQLENPLRQEAQDVIRKLSERKVRSIMLTGDRTDTAIRVGRKCGIADNSDACLNGRTIEGMALSEVARQTAYCSIFARLLPSQKGVLIRLLQRSGHCIAMLGDGPNDGIALKAADIGISFVENSSPVARGLSKILINSLDDMTALLKDAEDLKGKMRCIKILRIPVMLALLAGSYMAAFL
jgi:Ca2+-transporting ATPase